MKEQIITYSLNKSLLIIQSTLINFFTYLTQKATFTFYLIYLQHFKVIDDIHINVQKDEFVE